MMLFNLAMPSESYRLALSYKDRKDNARGYVKDNVRVISWRANRLKSDATLEELRLLVRDLEGV
jgi:hypothetical protein